MMKNKTDSLLLLIRNGQAMTLRQQLRLTVELSIPSIVAQISAIAMQYIDAAMVGRLGAGAAASIGLVSTTTWLFWGTCSAAATGFSVQVAHHVGASRLAEARAVLRQAILSVSIFSLALAGIGALISGSLPVWLGGTEEINGGASAYFLIFALSLPLLQLNFLAGSMLRCSGNMRVPGLLNVLMCLLDVVFNFFLIFPTREVEWFGLSLHMPGAGLGVTGAALGTAAAEAVVAGLMMWYLIARSNDLKLKGERGSFRPTWGTVRKALHIGLPMGVEHIVICGAQIMTTVIVAPLGVFAIAANSFGITAESLCYMPGYGIADAATTLVGQSLGAGRKDLTRRFARITVGMGMAVMGVMGVILYVGAPRGGLAHRSLCRADVRRRHRGLRRVCGRRQHIGALSDELLQHLGCTTDAGCRPGSFDGTERRMAGYVHRALLPRPHLPVKIRERELDENKIINH